MKVVKVKKYSVKTSSFALDSHVDIGYIKNAHGSLPDVDLDFQSDRRQEVKEYLERRYNHDGLLRVFSAGTFTTEKIRSVIKDVCRIHKISVATTNYITAIVDDAADWTDLMMTAFETKKVYDFVQKHWEVFEEIRPIMNQPRSAGVHASAIIITPEFIDGKQVNCFDLLPIRKHNGMLVSEIDGYSIDDIGLLKNDVLAIAELSRIAEMLKACNEEYSADLSIPKILDTDLNDPEIYNLIQRGMTQGIFQMSGQGMTRFMRQMRPDNINDLIAAIALFRPGALNSGAAQGYCDAKNGYVQPEYLFGTFDALKDTFGFIVYQEQVSKIARKVGGLSLADGVKLVKALSKKKIEKVRVFKDKFFEGAERNHCPKETAETIWKNVEDASKYLFNLSHSTAYGLTGFVGAWIKLHYPVVFYTVLLKYVDKDNLPTLMNEIRGMDNMKIYCPNINISTDNFITDYKENKIYWSILRVKQCGDRAVQFILRDRSVFGNYTSLENFIERIFKYKLKKYEYWDDEDSEEDVKRCPVNARCVKNLIMAGAFDELETIGTLTERYGLLVRAAGILGFKLKENEIPEDMIDKNYWWAQRQIELSEFGEVDYKGIYYKLEKPSHVQRYIFLDFRELENMPRNNKRTMISCFRVSEVTEKKYKDSRTGENKKFGKISVQQNTDLTEITMWSDVWEDYKPYFVVGKILVAVVMVHFSEFDGKNVLQINNGAFIREV